jgi:putative ABC transport system substrate-binding protein
MITRRSFLVVFGGSLVASPRICGAQQAAKVWRVGFLAAVARPPDGLPPASLRQAFTDLGYVEGKTIAYEGRWAEGKFARLPELAAELVRLKVDAIVVLGYPPAAAAKAASSTIPIVMSGSGDPVGTGLIASLARPGGNITGSSAQETELSAKRMQILKETVPRATRIAVLWNANDRAMTMRYNEIDRAARVLQLTVQPLGIGEPDDFDTAFSSMTRERPDALFMVADALTTLNRKRVIEFAAAHRIPAMYEQASVVQDGGLMSYGPNFDERFRRAAYYVDRIFKGAKAGELPVEQASKFDLAINLRTAKALGITIPQSVLLRADRVIE